MIKLENEEITNIERLIDEAKIEEALAKWDAAELFIRVESELGVAKDEE